MQLPLNNVAPSLRVLLAMADGAGIPGGDNRGDHILQAGLNGLLLNLRSELGILIMQCSMYLQ
ncbi:hypothetical protein [Serratia sp. NA_13]|uniref:hypothetical protein n=1 Tax=Serratia sp. NA_13 TaxID=3415658 RepID=UPI004046CCE0